MTRDSFSHLWNAFAKRRYGKPFTLELVNGCRIEINHPKSITLGKDLLAVRSTSGVLNYLEFASVVRFINETGMG
jgi:hypothetical protein